MLLFSHVGIPKDILIDQGTPFTSHLMVDLYWFLQVKHLSRSLYHPQTNRDIKRFKQTLKRMLWKVVAEEGKNWALLLPMSFLPSGKCYSASISFTPFELLLR